MNAQEQTVLVVDDESMVRKLITRFLRKLRPKWKVAEAADMPEAVAMLQELCPGLVIADMQMPAGNGIDLCRIIQGNPRLLNTRVLIMTGFPSSGARERALQSGACGFLGKPFELMELAGTIEKLLP